MRLWAMPGKLWQKGWQCHDAALPAGAAPGWRIQAMSPATDALRQGLADLPCMAHVQIRNRCKSGTGAVPEQAHILRWRSWAAPVILGRAGDLGEIVI